MFHRVVKTSTENTGPVSNLLTPVCHPFFMSTALCYTVPGTLSGVSCSSILLAGCPSRCSILPHCPVWCSAPYEHMAGLLAFFRSSFKHHIIGETFPENLHEGTPCPHHSLFLVPCFIFPLHLLPTDTVYKETSKSLWKIEALIWQQLGCLQPYLRAEVES